MIFLTSFLKVSVHGKASVAIVSQCLLYIHLYYELCYIILFLIGECDICKISNEGRRRKIFNKRGLLSICKKTKSIHYCVLLFQ